MSLTPIIARLTKVTDAQRECMFGLFSRYFSNVRREAFDRDMNEKDWVILLLGDQTIVGFSTLQLISLCVGGTEHLILFSGDTIVDRAHWHDSKLAGSFAHFMLRLLAEHPRTPLHWFLISKGYRTYRFLPVYFKHYYPAHDHATPAEYEALIHAVATHKFDGAFDPWAGLVRFGGRRDRLRPEMCEVPPSRLTDPHVRFFLERNPDYAQGDELACIADISMENLNEYARRVIRTTTVTWNE